MANFGNKGGRNPNQPALPSPRSGGFEIVESRCKVCNFAQRRELDMMLATGWSQVSVREHWNSVLGEDYFTPKNISIHARKHLSVKDSAVRRIIEERAMAIGMDIENVKEHILTKEAAAGTIIFRGLQNIHEGQTLVEPKDVLQAIQILKNLEADRSESTAEQQDVVITMFIKAVKEFVPESQWQSIWERFEELMKEMESPMIHTFVPHEESNTKGTLELVEGEYAETEDL